MTASKLYGNKHLWHTFLGCVYVGVAISESSSDKSIAKITFTQF